MSRYHPEYKDPHEYAHLSPDRTRKGYRSTKLPRKLPRRHLQAVKPKSARSRAISAMRKKPASGIHLTGLRSLKRFLTLPIRANGVTPDGDRIAADFALEMAVYMRPC